MQYIQLQSQDPNSLNNPLAGSFNIFIDETDNTLKVKDQAGEVYGGGGGGFSNITYSGLVNSITTSGLSAGSFYIITDFRTCYDQPDFNSFGNPITTGNYKQAPIEPIVVFATSVSTISIDAYQPIYPNDKIQYDWTYSTTETTNGLAYGRITERIDEFNNRTDYDHRTILFKRYRLFTHRQDQPLNGTIQLFSNGIVSGTSTSFNSLNVGDVIYLPNVNPSFYEITGITNNTSMGVSGDTIVSSGAGQVFYKANEETNDTNGYFSYKRTNVKTNDFVEYTTFGDAISENYAKNNYVGNFSNGYVTYEFNFLLANNVFLEGQYQSNKLGNYCFNNTFGTDNEHNTWGDWCYENVSTNDIDGNVIGDYFYGNLMNVNLVDNRIGNNFYNNRLLGENGGVESEQFSGNIIGNNFNGNTIYSSFYDNQIGNRFENNTIGDFGNLDNLEFRRNVILNDFNQNIIRKDFQNNQIGNQFNENVVNGDFYKNIIGNGFYFNQNIGHNFYGNHIGNGFNENDVIGDYFQDNQIGEYFNSNNNISYNFKNNQIGNQFENNTLGNTDYFNWVNTTIENLTGRTYDTFYGSLYGSEGNNVDNLILGKEFIMHDTVNDEYHKVKFTQWTLNDNGGGFSYERTKVHPTVEPTVIFTKTNGGNEVDVIVEGLLEITRDNNGAIYNYAGEGSWDSNQSPVGTEWNSIYTQNNDNNGSDFQDNIIDNEFKGNLILNDFAGNYVKSYAGGNEFSGNVYSNQIGSFTYDNQFLGEIVDNTWQDNFYVNVIGDSFNKNTFETDFGNNIIANNFQSNQIGNNFSDNTIGQDFFNNTIGENFYENTIGDGFQTNQIGSYFNNNTIADYFGYGYGAPQGNKIGSNFYNNTIGEYFYNNTIPDNFTENTIGNYFQWNVVNTSIDSTDFTPNYGNITGFTYTATGTSATDEIYTGLSGVTTSEFGVNATFDIEVSGGTVIGVSGNTEGKLYVTGDTITILGSQIAGGVPDDDILITVSGVTIPSVYGTYTCQLFERQGGAKRLSFYDENDTLTITNIDE
jgi:hypothetical protein